MDKWLEFHRQWQKRMQMFEPLLRWQEQVEKILGPQLRLQEKIDRALGPQLQAREQIERILKGNSKRDGIRSRFRIRRLRGDKADKTEKGI